MFSTHERPVLVALSRPDHMPPSTPNTANQTKSGAAGVPSGIKLTAPFARLLLAGTSARKYAPDSADQNSALAEWHRCASLVEHWRQAGRADEYLHRSTRLLKSRMGSAA